MNKKKLMTFGIIGFCALALVSAVAYYSFFAVTLHVTNPIQVTGDGDQTISSISPPEVVLGDMVRVDNNGNEDKEIVITTGIVQGDAGNVKVNYVGRLELDNKLDGADDPCVGTNWDRISDVMEGELYYFIVGDKFGYHLEAEGLKLSTSYSLIYYADPWAGNNPGALIGKATSDSNGDLTLEGSVELSMNLPNPSDDNAKDTCDYCTNNCNPIDSHCKGAKIWLVPSVDYNEVTKSLIVWNQADYLYETDLIHYFDNTDGKYTINANSYIEFFPLYDFDQYADGTYIINTQIA